MSTGTQNTFWVHKGSSSDFHRVVLEPAPEGTYILIYEASGSEHPEQDYLQDDVEDAKRFCEQDLGLGRDGWKEDSSIARIMS